MSSTSESPSPSAKPEKSPSPPAANIRQVPTLPEARQTPLSVLTEVVKSFEGRIAGVGALVGSIGLTLTTLKSLLEKWPLPSAIILGTFFLSIGWLVYLLLRPRSRGGLSSGWFVGLRPLSEADVAAARCLPRLAEQTQLIEKLRGDRGLFLYGERGCGKTSLLRTTAELDEKYYVIRIDGGVNLYARLRTALRDELRRHAASDEDKGTLKELLERLIARSPGGTRKILVVIDQLEEIFTSWIELTVGVPGRTAPHLDKITLEEKQAAESQRQLLRSQLGELREAILAIVAAHDSLDCNVLLCVQRVFMADADSFLSDGVSAAFPTLRGPEDGAAFADDEDAKRGSLPQEAPGLARMYLGMPTIAAVEPAMSTQNSGPWSEEITRRVLTEMAGGPLKDNQTAPINLAELQLIGQLLDELGIADVRSYPGRQRLLAVYLTRVTRELPQLTPAKARSLLASLLPGPQDRMQPIVSEGQLAQRLSIPDTQVRNALRGLRETFRLIEHYVRETRPVRSQIYYRLGPSSVIPLLRDALGVSAGVEQRTELLMSNVRAQLALAPRKYVLSISDWLWLRKNPPLERPPHFDELMRRSRRQFLLFPILPLVSVIGLVCLVRFGVYRLDVAGDRNELVIKRGLGVLSPILGSSEVAVGTGIYLKNVDWIDQLPAGVRLLKDVQEQRVYWHFLSPLSARFDVHRQLQASAEQLSWDYMDYRRRNPSYVGSRTVDPLLLDIRTAINYRGEIPAPKGEPIENEQQYLKYIRDALEDIRKECEPKSLTSVPESPLRGVTLKPPPSAIDNTDENVKTLKCSQAQTRLQNLSAVIPKLNREVLRKEFVVPLQKKFATPAIDKPYSALFNIYRTALFLFLDSNEKLDFHLQRITHVVKPSWSELSWEEANDILDHMRLAYRLLDRGGPAVQKTVAEYNERMHSALTREQARALRELLLYSYAGGKLLRRECKTASEARCPKALKDFKDSRCAPVVDDGAYVDDAIVLFGLQQKEPLDIVNLLIKEIRKSSPSIQAPEQPAEIFCAAPPKPATPTPGATPQTPAPTPTTTPPASTTADGTTPPAAPSPDATTQPAPPRPPGPPENRPLPFSGKPGEPGSRVLPLGPPLPPTSSAPVELVTCPPVRATSDETCQQLSGQIKDRLSSTAKLDRPIKILFALQRHYTAAKVREIEPDIMRGLIALLDRSLTSAKDDDGKLKRDLDTQALKDLISALESTISAPRITSKNWLKTEKVENAVDTFAVQLESSFDYFLQTMQNRGSSERERYLRALVRALLVSGKSVRQILKKMTDRTVMPIDQSNSEDQILILLSSVYTEENGQIHFDGQPETARWELWRLVKHYIDQKDSKSSQWAAIALYLGLAEADEDRDELDERVLEMTLREDLAHAYALRRLLNHTAGFIQGDDQQSAMPSEFENQQAQWAESSDHQRPVRVGDLVGRRGRGLRALVEQPTATAERLLGELLDDHALRSSAYRAALVEALILLARAPQSVSVRSPLGNNVNALLKQDSLPLPLRLSLWKILDSLRDPG